MNRFARSVFPFAMTIALTVSRTASADSLQRCRAEKIRAAATQSACLASEQIRALKGKVSDPSACIDKFVKTIARAGSCRFVDNGDGTVSDLDTALIWEKGAQGSGCLLCSDLRTWSNAMGDWISQVNGLIIDNGSNEPGLGGHSDWRVPTVQEL